MLSLHAASIVTSLLAFFAAATSTFTSRWFITTKTNTTTIGHLQYCHDGVCMFGLDRHTWMSGASFVFMLFSVCTLLVGAIMLMKALWKSSKAFLGFGSKTLSFGGGFAVISVSLFTGMYIRAVIPPTSSRFGYSYALAWIAAVLGIASGLMAGMAVSASPVGIPFVSLAKTKQTQETLVQPSSEDKEKRDVKQETDCIA